MLERIEHHDGRAQRGQGRPHPLLHLLDGQRRRQPQPHRLGDLGQQPATVTRVVDLGDRRLVLLDAGQPLAAEVTPASVAELGLEPGASVVALAKAYAFQPL